MDAWIWTLLSKYVAGVMLMVFFWFYSSFRKLFDLPHKGAWINHGSIMMLGINNSRRLKLLSVVNMGINLNTACRHTKIYQQGVNNFIAFAFENSAVESKILCPCRKRVNSFWRKGYSATSPLW